MAKVEIEQKLFQEIKKRFGGESHKIIDLLETLEENPKKGKFLCQIGGVALKELKYKSFRFYFITDNYRLHFLDIGELNELLIRFIRMSHKNLQQKTINEMKKTLKDINKEEF